LHRLPIKIAKDTDASAITVHLFCTVKNKRYQRHQAILRNVQIKIILEIFLKNFAIELD
jgi:hypothetical protein